MIFGVFASQSQVLPDDNVVVSQVKGLGEGHKISDNL